MLRADLTVATPGELSTVHVSGVAEGANAWVDSVSAYYTLVKNFVGTPPASAVLPLAGSPNAGAAGAVWVPNGGLSNEVVQSEFLRLVNDAPPSPTAGTFVTLISATLSLSGGSVDVEASASVANSTPDDDVLVQLFVDNVATGIFAGTAPPGGLSTSNVSIMQRFKGGVAPLLPPGPHTFDLRYAPVTSGVPGATCPAGSPSLHGAQVSIRVTEYAGVV
jgi:hypothetical protein